MASNILNIPFRKTHSISLSNAVKQYISGKYDQHPDLFTKDLKAIDELRRQAVAVLEPHAASIAKIQAYAAQLVWMGGKFPVDLGAEFTWYPALGDDTQTPMVQDNIRFELANVLFNLAALYCQLAVASNRSTGDGLRTASNHFCSAAGVISHLKSAVLPEMGSNAPEDMDVMTLECLEQLMLAQAQECFWQKAVKDNFKDLSIAKLASSVSDLYLNASEAGKRATAIVSPWIYHITAKHFHFAAAAQYRAACDCLEKRKYGEEVARLQTSLSNATKGLQNKNRLKDVVAADLNGLKSKAQADLKVAEKDNDDIYLQVVPTNSELKPLDRASMVSSKIPREVLDPVTMLHETNSPLGKPLFTRLVPYAVHVASSVYANRREHRIDHLVNEMETLTARVHSLLQSLNLPGSLQALEKPLGLPPGLVSHAEEIRHQNGPDRLARAMSDVDKLKSADKAVYQEGLQMLRTEAIEDEQARLKYGTDRWSRPMSEEEARPLYNQVEEVQGYFNAADGSDQTVREKGAESEAIIRLLNGTNADLEKFVPNSRRAAMTPAVQSEVNKLRSALNDVGRMESRRKRKIEALRAKAQVDDVNAELLAEASRFERDFPMQKIEAAQFEDLFDARLNSRYRTDEDDFRKESKEQADLLSQLAAANTAFVTVKQGDASISSEREKALQELENTYFAYKDLVQNLDVGRKFYNDLASIVAKFRDDCRAFAYRRRAEATSMERDIMTALPLPAIGNLQLTDQHQQQQQHQQAPQASTSMQPPRRPQPQSQSQSQPHPQPQSQSQPQPQPSTPAAATGPPPLHPPHPSARPGRAPRRPDAPETGHELPGREHHGRAVRRRRRRRGRRHVDAEDGDQVRGRHHASRARGTCWCRVGGRWQRGDAAGRIQGRAVGGG